jgi:iron complex transport system ATP-binding protein
MSTVLVEHLTYKYDRRPILRDISLSLGRGKVISLLGPNGAGKSTFFKCVLGLLEGYGGRISIDGVDIRKMSAREQARKIAYIPQSHQPAFNFTVLDMVLMGASAHTSSMSPPGKEAVSAAMESLERLGMADLSDRIYTHISGGERQLVMIARALTQRAPIMIMDEPTANLDFGNQMVVFGRIRELAGQGYTVIQSTHNPDQAYAFSHEIIAMKSGRVVAYGTPQEVISQEIIQQLYDIETEVIRLCDNRFQTSVPKFVYREGW